MSTTIRVASQEESRSLQPARSRCCSSLTTKCSYYSAEGWLSQPMMAQTKQVASMERASPTHQAEGEEETEGNSEASPVSPTLDVSIESLNQLILEIDPTFQPLLLKPDSSKKHTAQSTSPGSAAVSEKPDPDSLEIKYIEMTPTRAKSQESMQGSASPCVTPLSMSPQGSCFLLARDNCTPNGSLVFSTPQNQPPTGSSPQIGYRASECVSIPQRGQKDCISYGPNTLLATSPGLESLRKALYIGRAQQRTSRVSMLSTSPGSDTSYVLGSTQSLLNDDSDSYQPAHRSTESPLSVGPFGSPCLTSPSVQGDRFGDAFSPGSNSSKVNNCSSPPLQKGHASSCPPSIVNSLADIPILLVNGCLEHGETSPRMGKDFQGSIKQTFPPSLCLSAKKEVCSCAMHEGMPLSLAGSSKDGEPTMKFVMDTSKYWFKPSITRDQAIQLLKEAEPGAFLMRDSTSYRGSFGLAMKVLSSPSELNSPGESYTDLVRHFLIESSAKGVHLKGASEEPYFGSLSAFVYQHAMTALALPCKLAIPTRGGCRPSVALTLVLCCSLAACNVLYLNSVSVETLTGASAVQKAVSSTFELETPPTPTIVHFKVTEQGITLTDVQRKVFFRRHYPLAALSFCSMDPENRKIFGFVAKSQTDAENLCHLFAEYDTVQPASLVIDFISKLLPEQ
uniref:Tensin 4 n=1 Tax=Chelonoidis abingdonii TaxID=106734 RepID=A0A8C0H0D6_CHEAB